jgi:hypothetical protein
MKDLSYKLLNKDIVLTISRLLGMTKARQKPKLRN